MLTVPLQTLLSIPPRTASAGDNAVQSTSAGDVLPMMFLLVAVLLCFAVSMLRRAIRPIRVVLGPLCAFGLAALAVGAALVILAAAAVVY